MSNIITGLDIGSSQIKGVTVTPKKDGALQVVTAFKHPSAGFRRGILVDLEEATMVLRDLVLDLQKISKKTTQNVFVNINSEHVKARSSRGVTAVSRADQIIQKEDLERVFQESRALKLSPNYLVLHNIIKEFFVDDVGEIADPLGMTGNRLEASTLVVEAFAPQVNTLVKCLERVGVKVGGLIFNPLAAARAVLTKRQKELGVMLVDFGYGTTSLVIYEEGKVMHTKSLPIGSGYVTNDIAIGLKTSVDAAEKLKTSYGYAMARDISRREMVSMHEVDPESRTEISKRFLAEIIEVRLVEILDLIDNEMKVLGRSVHLPSGAVVTGGGMKLPGFLDLVKQKLKLPTHIGYPELKGFEFANPAHETLLEDPEMAVAIGLVLWGYDDGVKDKSGIGAIKNFLKNLIP